MEVPTGLAEMDDTVFMFSFPLWSYFTVLNFPIYAPCHYNRGCTLWSFGLFNSSVLQDTFKCAMKVAVPNASGGLFGSHLPAI